MWLDAKAPKLMPQMSQLVVETIYIAAGDELKVGQKLFDVTVDLGRQFSQSCPPVSHYRLVAREAGRVQRLCVVEGQARAGDDLLAVMSGELDAADEAGPRRPFRMASAGILSHPRMWSANQGA
ncbi:MAG TPA: hypothetical protein VG248_16050 [Caulobacteraceae bacterium]|jgi:hypothetical protein|nr:hypothetical protein [Caulobacteraceae bacterium]